VSVLPDTDIVIEIQRGNDPQVRAKWASLVTSGEMIFYSPVVAAETWAGARTQEHPLVESFFDSLTCAPADYETGKLAGELMRKFARSHGLEIPDALIAASSIQHRAALWTRNRKHYPMPQLVFFGSLNRGSARIAFPAFFSAILNS
jgi:predicted nucleic acid-binding protein